MIIKVGLPLPKFLKMNYFKKNNISDYNKYIMSGNPDLLKEMNKYIKYTNTLEKAYVKKHQEIEYIYQKIMELKADIPNNKINKLVTEIQEIISPNSQLRLEQRQVFDINKDIPETLPEKKELNTKVRKLDKKMKNLKPKIQDY